jgi:ribose transport system permease protein
MADKSTLDTTERSTTSGATRATPPQQRPPSRFSPAQVWQSAGPLAIFAALLALVAVLQPGFFGPTGLNILAVQATPILLLALGTALVLHVGSIDLSVAAMTILGAILLAMTLGDLAYAAPVVVIGIMTLVGVVNGLLVAFGQVPSIALTLGTLGILQAAALLLSGATTVYVTANREVIQPLFQVTFAGLPLAFWLAVLMAVVLWVVLRFTTMGQGLTAVGLNETGAIFSGLRTRWLKVTAFGLSGFLAGMAGIVIIAQAGAASTFGIGSDLLLPAIAAAIVGGTAITGGVTNPINVIFGALTVTLIPIAAAAVGVDTQARLIVYGAVIIVAVALTMSRSSSGVVK